MMRNLLLQVVVSIAVVATSLLAGGRLDNRSTAALAFGTVVEQHNSTIKKLTGTSSKTWTYVTTEFTLRQEDNCTYEFRAARTVHIRGCSDGNGEFEWKDRWDGIDTFIEFRNQEYRLIVFDQEASGETFEEAVLRSDGDQGGWTTDIILRHED